ncbi:MAG TPA: amidohydrolase family protein [Acidimicrobiales bacterium]|nr:amidohydrolase family protein [Acidimicrobiales bacterium]
MIIDCHGHYTTAPESLWEWRRRQIEIGDSGDPGYPTITDDEIRGSLESAQLKLQAERGTDVTIFSPRASAMAHHVGSPAMSQRWAEVSNDLIYRVVNLYPKNFVGVCQLPQSPGSTPSASIAELERSVNELGFVGCNLTPDTSGGYWQDPPLSDRSFYPLYEKMVELDVPAMVHVSASCNPAVHMTGAHYLNADTTSFMQLLMSDLFKDFPTLKMIVPHGGGAVPYHWGRYRGLAQDNGRAPLEESMLQNVYFDTCVYHLPGMECLFKVVPVDNILFASEMVGAVRGIDPRSGHYYDDTKRYVDEITTLSDADRKKIYEDNSRAVFSRLNNHL